MGGAFRLLTSRVTYLYLGTLVPVAGLKAGVVIQTAANDTAVALPSCASLLSAGADHIAGDSMLKSWCRRPLDLRVGVRFVATPNLVCHTALSG